MNSAPDRNWVEQAACRDDPVRRFTHPDGPEDIRAACRTCATCPVRQACLTTALAHPSYADAGIWGGTTEAQRSKIRQGRLTVEESLQHDPDALVGRSVAVSTSERPAGDRSDGAGTGDSGNARPRATRPRVTVHRDPYGDYTDASSRVIIFKIFGDPPYMLMIDRRLVVRATTSAEAAEEAWVHLHAVDREPPTRPDVPCPAGIRRTPNSPVNGRLLAVASQVPGLSTARESRGGSRHGR